MWTSMDGVRGVCAPWAHRVRGLLAPLGAALLLSGLLGAGAQAQGLHELPGVPAKAQVALERSEELQRAAPDEDVAKYNASNVSLEGSIGYAISNGNVRLVAERVANRRSGGTSGTLKLELWALSAPYQGGNGTGYKLAQTTLGTLPAGYYGSVDRTVSLLTTPANGTWYIVMFLTEYAAAPSNSGYVVMDWGNFPTPVVVGGGSDGGNTTAPKVTVYELLNVVSGHYFRTSSADEVAAIAAGSAGPGWMRTMDDFTAYAAQSSGAGSDVCRFYSRTSNSHFYTASADECNGLRRAGGEWNYEGLSFRIQQPSSGSCASNLRPVYRLYNNRHMYTDSNHRFTTDASEVGRLQESGWVYEGVAFCALS